MPRQNRYLLPTNSTYSLVVPSSTVLSYMALRTSSMPIKSNDGLTTLTATQIADLGIYFFQGRGIDSLNPIPQSNCNLWLRLLTMTQQFFPNILHYNSSSQNIFKVRSLTTNGILYPTQNAVWPIAARVPVAFMNINDFIATGAYKLHPTKLKNVTHVRNLT